MNDKLLPLSLLEKWQNAFTDAEVIQSEAGHYVHEEDAESLTRLLI